jgi:hypothetical protein
VVVVVVVVLLLLMMMVGCGDVRGVKPAYSAVSSGWLLCCISF